MPSVEPRDLYSKYAAGVAYIAVRQHDGTESIGSAFHVGEGIFITARHVVEGNTILHIATTVGRYVPDSKGLTHISGRKGRFTYIPAAEGKLAGGPYLATSSNADVAALKVAGIDAPVIPLGTHYDDLLNDDEFMLSEVVLFGYPPVPFSREPRLIAARGEVNTIIDKYTGGHPHFIVSVLPRGGFSGGPCMTEWDFALGVITESLLHNNMPTELGYHSVLTVEPIYHLLEEHNILPKEQVHDDV